MKFLIYHKPGQEQVNQVMQAVFSGAEKAGFNPVLRNSVNFKPKQAEKTDIVFLWGLKARNREILNTYHSQQTPVIVSDLGYLKRGINSASKEAYYQMGMNQLNWLPSKICSANRFKQLNIALPKTSNQFSSQAFILLCGQVPGDAQHNMDLAQIQQWATKTLATIRRYSKRPVVWRPHPLDPFQIKGADAYSDPKQETLQDRLQNCHALVTYNSNSANEALLQGVPVFCPPQAKCTYLKMANHDLSQIETPTYLLTKIEQYFYNLAYAQWTREEIATGECFNFLKNIILESETLQLEPV